MSRPGPEPGGGPAHGRDPLSFAELLCYALHAAADQVEPGADGLIPIRARILAGSGVPWRQALAISQYWVGPNRKV
jgi:hypothetical protein